LGQDCGNGIVFGGNNAGDTLVSGVKDSKHSGVSSVSCGWRVLALERVVGYKPARAGGGLILEGKHDGYDPLFVVSKTKH
jgi:hypothetical protein